MSLPPRQRPAPPGLDETDDVGDPVAVGAQGQYWCPAAADGAGMAMVFTGVRHFRH